MVQVGDIAALTAAGAFVLLVLLVAYPLVKLGRTLDEASRAIRLTQDGATPLLAQARNTMDSVTTQLDEVEDITRRVSSITSNVAGLTSVVSATLGGPLIKVSAFGYGVRTALARRQQERSGGARPALPASHRALGRAR